IVGVLEDRGDIEKTTDGGSRPTEANELTVMATGPSPISAVTTATPAGNCRNASRKSSARNCSNGPTFSFKLSVSLIDRLFIQAMSSFWSDTSHKDRIRQFAHRRDTGPYVRVTRITDMTVTQIARRVYLLGILLTHD